ncbi:Phytosulfokine receptor 1 [Vitis vinifera]|uniref:Phytosulfokine receptor 1 n=1 Tax=Vitis vinifera TaxID=29760 RepID=A0A438F1Q4_VITVI|nr:Phytosulfokine receptor 1 [Vitis vinifera]
MIRPWPSSRRRTGPTSTREISILHDWDRSLFQQVDRCNTPEIGNLSQVHALNLSHNILTGPIPAAFSGLKSIESLDLSYNNLTGTIPEELTKLTNLAVFSVAYNNFSGKIPEMTAHRAEEEAEIEEGEKGLTDRDIFYVSFGASYVVVLLGVAAVLYINGVGERNGFMSLMY